MNLEEDKRAAGDTASDGHRPDAASGLDVQTLQSQFLSLPMGSSKPHGGRSPRGQRMEHRSARRTPVAETISVTKLQLQDDKEGKFPDVFPRFWGEMTATATPTLGKMSVNETCKVKLSE